MRFGSQILLTMLALTTPAWGHIELRATLDGAQEFPPIVTTATGTATFELDPVARTLEYQIQPTGLSGPVALAHIHTGKRGVSGPPDITLSNTLSGTISDLSDEKMAALVSGGTYANLHTAANLLGGEIRGQIELVNLTGTTCGCATATAPGKFRSCVRNALKGLDQEDKKSAEIKRLKAAVKKSSCGKTKGPKKAIGCCLAYTAQENIVIERICAPITAKACGKLAAAGAEETPSCFDSVQCSPSGAFID